MTYYLVSWRQLKGSRMTNNAEIVSCQDENEAMTKMVEYNRQKRYSTTEYRIHSLNDLLEKNSLIYKKLYKHNTIKNNPYIRRNILLVGSQK